MSNPKPAVPPFDFRTSIAANSEWERGLRAAFEYRDLGISQATHGRYVAHVIRACHAIEPDAGTGPHWHEVDFQMVYVLKGWVTFLYEGEGEFTFRPGDSVLQPSGVRHALTACSDDMELLEIVSPADFPTHESDEAVEA